MFCETLKKMKITFSLTSLLLGFLLVGFSKLTPATDRNTPIFRANNSGQMLPINATVIMGTQTIELEVATTPYQKAIGLMYREFLPANRGMLFIFERPQYVGFWMKNVRISLDMIFLLDGKIVSIAANVPPCTADPCPSYGPPQQIDRVIELRGGRAAELGLQPGDSLEIKYLEP